MGADRGAGASGMTQPRTPASAAGVQEAADIQRAEETVFEPTDLQSSVRSGLGWSVVVSIVVQVSRIVSSLVLVRLLSPSDYGLASMAMVVVALVSNFQDVGFGAGLIQRRTITETDRSTVFWATAALGAFSTLILIGLSVPIADFFNEPQVRNLVIGLSFTLFIGSLGLTQGALVHRAMNFRATAVRIIVANVGATVAAIAVAAAGGGAWALIAYQLAITSLITVLLWQLAAWRPRFVFSRTSLKRFSGFGFNVLGARGLDFLQTNVDNILVGRVLGPTSLGLYTVSYNVILIPLGRLFQPISGVLFAAGSRLQDDRERLARLWIRAARGALAVILPAVLGLLVVTPDFVHVVFGSKWEDAVPVIRVLGFVTVAYGLSMLADNVLLSLDKANLVFRLRLLNTVLAIGAFVVGLQWGVVGVAASYAVVTIPMNLWRVFLANMYLGVSLPRFARSLARTVEASLGMALICWFARVGLSDGNARPWVQLVVVVATGIVVYGAWTYLRNREVVDDFVSLIARRRRKSDSAAEPGVQPAGSSN